MLRVSNSFSLCAYALVSGTDLNRVLVLLSTDVRYSAKFHVLTTKLENNVILRQCQQAIAKIVVGDTTCK